MGCGCGKKLIKTTKLNPENEPVSDVLREKILKIITKPNKDKASK